MSAVAACFSTLESVSLPATMRSANIRPQFLVAMGTSTTKSASSARILIGSAVKGRGVRVIVRHQHAATEAPHRRPSCPWR